MYIGNIKVNAIYKGETAIVKILNGDGSLIYKSKMSDYAGGYVEGILHSETSQTTYLMGNYGPPTQLNASNADVYIDDVLVTDFNWDTRKFTTGEGVRDYNIKICFKNPCGAIDMLFDTTNLYTKIDTSHVDFTNVGPELDFKTNTGFFSGNSLLKELIIGDFSNSKVTSFNGALYQVNLEKITMKGMPSNLKVSGLNGVARVGHLTYDGPGDYSKVISALPSGWTSSSTDIYGASIKCKVKGNHTNINLLGEQANQFNSNNTVIMIDDKEVPFTKNYLFDDNNEHNVQYLLSDINDISNMFNGCTSITEAELFNRGQNLFNTINNMDNMFANCSSLIKVTSNVTFNEALSVTNMFANVTTTGEYIHINEQGVHDIIENVIPSTWLATYEYYEGGEIIATFDLSKSPKSPSEAEEIAGKNLFGSFEHGWSEKFVEFNKIRVIVDKEELPLGTKNYNFTDTNIHTVRYRFKTKNNYESGLYQYNHFITNIDATNIDESHRAPNTMKRMYSDMYNLECLKLNIYGVNGYNDDERITNDPKLTSIYLVGGDCSSLDPNEFTGLPNTGTVYCDNPDAYPIMKAALNKDGRNWAFVQYNQ